MSLNAGLPQSQMKRYARFADKIGNKDIIRSIRLAVISTIKPAAAHSHSISRQQVEKVHHLQHYNHMTPEYFGGSSFQSIPEDSLFSITAESSEHAKSTYMTNGV